MAKEESQLDVEEALQNKKCTRMRCPFCGMLVWESQLNRDYDLELLIQVTDGRTIGYMDGKLKLQALENLFLQRLKRVIEHLGLTETLAKQIVKMTRKRKLYGGSKEPQLELDGEATLELEPSMELEWV